ncbi:unnamed protein product, partial [Coregonus sp. 'balchen']
MFTFLLGVFKAIFGLTELLFQALQSKSLDVRHYCVWVDSTLNALKAIRSDAKFQRIYDNTIQIDGMEDERRKRLSRGWDDYEQGLNHRDNADNDPGFLDRYQQLYFKILYGIILHMTQRFADMKSLDFFCVLDHGSFPEYSKQEGFPDRVVYADASFHKPPGELLQSLVKNYLTTTLPEVCKLLKRMLTIPVTSTSAERSFSCLKRIKTYLHNSCEQERLTHLAEMSMETCVLHELKSSGVLYDIVIYHFASMKERK